MVDYGRVRGSKKPDELVIDDYSVWKHTDIEEVTETDVETGDERTEYEYNMVRYSKEEFILMQAEENEELAEQLTQTQLALCEIYESME